MVAPVSRTARSVLVAAFVLAACGEPTPSLNNLSPAADTQVGPTTMPGEVATTSTTDASQDLSADLVTTSTTKPPTDDLPAEQIPSTTSASGVAGEVPQDLLSKVLADASDRSGLPVDAISVIRGEFVVWPDGSLGCAVPGEMYTQATVDGYWIVLSATGDEYDYRATATGFFKLCEDDGPPTQPDG